MPRVLACLSLSLFLAPRWRPWFRLPRMIIGSRAGCHHTAEHQVQPTNTIVSRSMPCSCQQHPADAGPFFRGIFYPCCMHFLVIAVSSVPCLDLRRSTVGTTYRTCQSSNGSVESPDHILRVPEGIGCLCTLHRRYQDQPYKTRQNEASCHIRDRLRLHRACSRRARSQGKCDAPSAATSFRFWQRFNTYDIHARVSRSNSFTALLSLPTNRFGILHQHRHAFIPNLTLLISFASCFIHPA